MADKYYAFNPDNFENFLASKGFGPTNHHYEIVYVRRHHKCPHLFVKVYTTISVDRGTRASGADAIRVVAIFDNGQRSFGVGKFPKIYRKAPEEISEAEKQNLLFERVLVRMREAYARCNEWCKQNTQKYKS